MDTRKLLEQEIRRVVVGIAAYEACLVPLVLVFEELAYMSESMSEEDTSREESEQAESASVHQSVGIQASPPSGSSSRGAMRKAPMADRLSESLGLIAKSLGMIAEALSDCNRAAREAQRRVYAGDEVWVELKKLELGGNEVLFDAFKFLMMDEKITGAFFGCPAEMRKEFLLFSLSRRSQS